MKTIKAMWGGLVRVFSAGSGLAGKAMGILKRGLAVLVQSVRDFVASPKVWAAGVLFFMVGWFMAFSFGQVRRVVTPPPSVALLAEAKARIAALEGELVVAKGAVDAAEKRARAAEEAAKAPPKVIYRSRPQTAQPAQKPSETGKPAWMPF